MTQFTLDFSEPLPSKPMNRMQEVAAIFAAVSDDYLRELYCNQALPPAKIGEILGVTYPAVVRQLRLRGIPLRDRYAARDASIASGRYAEAIRKSWEGADERKAQMSIEKRGRAVSESTKAKLRARPITEEWRKKLSIAATGQVHSEEHKRKVSEALKGQPGVNVGRKYPNRYGTKNAHLVDYFRAGSANACRFLGFLFADGNIVQRHHTYGISVHIHAKDRDMLEAYLADIGVDLPLASRMRGKYGPYVSVQFCDRALGEYLINTWGIVPRKSYVNPPFPVMSDEQLAHFAAGHFEGDGSVGHYHGSLYVRIVGSPTFMKGLSHALSSLLQIPYKEPKLHGTVYMIGWNKRTEVKKIYDCFYPEGEYVHMPRKRQIFEDFFKGVSKYVPTAEHRMKVGAATKLRMQTDEARARTGAINRGKIFSEDTRAKISAAHKGKKLSEDHRAKIGNGLRKQKRQEATNVSSS